jgi:hypothetical protein
MGDRHAREIELAQNFDFNIGRKNSMRASLLFEAGWWDGDQRSNAFGTSFTSNAAFEAGTPPRPTRSASATRSSITHRRKPDGSSRTTSV